MQIFVTARHFFFQMSFKHVLVFEHSVASFTNDVTHTTWCAKKLCNLPHIAQKDVQFVTICTLTSYTFFEPAILQFCKNSLSLFLNSGFCAIYPLFCRFCAICTSVKSRCFGKVSVRKWKFFLSTILGLWGSRIGKLFLKRKKNLQNTEI